MPIMDSLSKFAKSVGDGAKTAVKKSEDMVEIAKLNKAISNEEDRIKLTYVEIGKDIYSRYEKKETIQEELVELCNRIDEFQKNIMDIRVKIAQLKNTKLCSSCGAELELNSEFCVKCGGKQEIVQSEVDESVEEIKEEQVQKEQEEAICKPKFCPSCGQETSPDSKFCQGCGTKLF